MRSDLTESSALKNPVQASTGFIVDYVRIPTVEDAKSFFGPITDQERAWRGEVYFDALLTSARSRLGIGDHDRAEAYIFGNGLYPKDDSLAHASHFPVSVKVMWIDDLFIGPNEVLDLTAYADEFPWPIGSDEIYVRLTINRLILSPGSKITIKGNVFIMNCGEAIADNIKECDQVLIELNASDSIQHSRISRRLPVRGNIKKGYNGEDGQPLKRESTPFGVRLSEATDVSTGRPGAAGSKGVDGTAGPNGAMLFLADIRFGELKGFQKQSIKICAGAAPGFPGGNGEDGGDGGNGGKGASGSVTPFGIVHGSQGGQGGQGGNGGKGGQGGRGGLACDIFVSVPHLTSSLFETETHAAAGGRGGNGGSGGKAGKPGANGNLCEEGSTISRPEDGIQGPNGHEGKTGNAPVIHIYQRH